MARIAINGLGRIGRAVFKIAQENQHLEIVAVNDLLTAGDLAYLLKFDSVYGRYGHDVKVEGDDLVIDGRRIRKLSAKDPAELPWKEMRIDIALECSGRFTRTGDLMKHVSSGARHAILSAPPKDGDIRTVVPGVNHADRNEQVFSTASCTTNCVTPVVEIMGRRIGFEKAIMTTVHAYTSSQSLVDGPNKVIRRGRAAALNLVPAATGAGKTTTMVLPEHKGKFDGIAIRCPLPAGSISDLVFVTSRDTSVDEINAIFTEESQTDRYRGILKATDEQIVSSDIIADTHASIVDLTLTRVVGGNLVKIMSWYDNEWGYAAQMVREAERIAQMAE